MLRVRLSPLWRNANFLKLWTGETISLTGTQMGIPFVVLLLLGASHLLQGMIYDINWISLSQVIVPSGMQGRLNAAMSLCVLR
jgi:hypothetical protein